jgi:hypothetical protein
VSFAEQAVNQQESSKDKTQKNEGNDASLPVRNACPDNTNRLSFYQLSYFEN